MSIIREFTLYLHAGITTPEVIHANQYSQGETWIFKLLQDDGSVYVPSTGALIGVKADGHAIAGLTGTVLGDGRVSITTTQQLTAAAGDATCELTIDGGTNGSANFVIRVEKKPTDDAILSESDLSIIQEGLNSVTPAAIEEKVSDWLEENFTEPPVDQSLTIANAAADAKVTGDKITELKTAITNVASEKTSVNLFNMNYAIAERYFTNNNGTVERAYSASYNGYIFPVEAGKTYTFTGFDYIAILAKDGAYRSNVATGAPVSITIPSDSDVNEIYLSLNKNTYPIKSYMIVEGETLPPSYVPHFYPAELNHNISIKNVYDFADLVDDIATYENDVKVSIPTPTLSEGYVNTSGVMFASDTYNYTSHIPVNTGEEITLADGSDNIRFVTAYKDGVPIPSLGTENVRRYNVPTGVDSVVLSYFVTAASYTIRLRREGRLYTLKIAPEVSEIREQVESLIDSVAETKNLGIVILPEFTTAEGYVRYDGYEAIVSSYVHTSRIPVNGGDTITTVAHSDGTPYLMRFVAAYNGESVVSASGAESVRTYTVPSGIDNIIISVSSSFEYSTMAVMINRNGEQYVLKYDGNVLFGKKWAVCGDSFTAGVLSTVIEEGRYFGKKRVYPYLIANRNNMLIENFFASGRTIGYPSDGSFSNSLTNPSATFYYQNIPSDVDYITIYLGINDSHHENGTGGDGEDPTGIIPLGTITDNTTATYYGAWNVVLTWLIKNRPFAHIGIIVSNGCDRVAYRTAQLEIARKYGIPFIDLNGDDRTPVMIRSQNTEIAENVRLEVTKKQAVDYSGAQTGSVNLHPSDAAHMYESFFIEDFLRSI